MEPILFDLNGAQNLAPPSLEAPTDCSSGNGICSKRRLESRHDDLESSPRKKRKCNTVPPDNRSTLDAELIKDHEYGNLSLSNSIQRIKPPHTTAQSASPQHSTVTIHPTVTILSSYDDSHLDGHHSNVAIRNPKAIHQDNININTSTGVTIKIESEGEPQKKPVFSMTIQKKPNNIHLKNKTVNVFNCDGSAESIDTKEDEHTDNHNNEENHNPNNTTSIPPPPIAITADFAKETEDGTKEGGNTERIPKQNGEESPPKEDSAESGEIVMNTKQSRLMRLLLDAKRVGGLIGKGGAAITKIREESRAKILIAKPIPHSLFRICSIEGEYEEIVRGINLVIDKMAEESTRLPPFQITILVEEKNIGCLIGKKGNAITEIRNNTNANIYISSHLLRNSSEKTVDICGERDAVHNAIEMVIKRLCSNPSFVSTRMPYDPSMDFLQSPMKSLCEHPMSYPYPYFTANNPRLLNYALNNHRFGGIASVQPQIISTSISTPSLLTPLLSNTFSFRASAPAFNIPPQTPQTSNPNLSKQSSSNSMISHTVNNTINNTAHHRNNRNNNSNNPYIRPLNVIAHNTYNNNNNNINNNNNTQSNNNNRFPHFQRVAAYTYSPRIIPPIPVPVPSQHGATSVSAQTSVVLPVAAHLIGGVIGRGGRNIQEIRRQTNAEIKIDNERQNKTKERYITINGTPQQISTAVYMIQNSLATHT